MTKGTIHWEKAWTELEKQIQGAIVSVGKQKGKAKEKQVLVHIQQTMEEIEKTYRTPQTKTKQKSPSIQSSKPKRKKRMISRRKKKKTFIQQCLEYFGLD
jgi:dsRNA-specific ribonuclease